MNAIQSVCVFCGAGVGRRREYATAARELGEAVAGRGLTLVYGGGTVGLMGEVARAAHAAGGEVTGILPTALAPKELSGERIGNLHIVDTMHTRKETMARHADAFIALPGGYGTLEELFEVVTWAQIGYHRKPIGLLNVAGYFDPLLALVDHAVTEGFVQPRFRRLLLCETEPARLLDRLADHRLPPSFLDGLGLEET